MSTTAPTTSAAARAAEDPTTATPAGAPTRPLGTAPLLGYADYQAIVDLFQDYAHTLDAGDWERWPEFFTAQCVYRLQPRENHERGLPLATLAFDSQGMLRDRVYGIRETLFHDPYYQRHIVGAPRVLAVGQVDGLRQVRTQASYVVIRTKLDQLSQVFNTGRYLDTVVHTPEGWRFARRECIYDSEMIPNSIIYPI